MIADSILPSLLATAETSDAFNWKALSVLLILVVGANSLFQLMGHIKGKKPDAQDLQTFATKDEHKALCQRVNDEHEKIHTHLKKIEDKQHFENSAIQRALGRIEGKLDDL